MAVSVEATAALVVDMVESVEVMEASVEATEESVEATEESVEDMVDSAGMQTIKRLQITVFYIDYYFY